MPVPSTPPGPIPAALAGDGLPPCFVAGTRIQTTSGALLVETLQPGNEALVALGGRVQPIIWLGHRHLDCRHHPEPQNVWPVCVSAGAFGPARPFRDLFLSPDHALFIDGALIPVRYLVNGRTIFQQPRDAVTYWHVELAEHNVLYAEGVPAESYLDTGNRGAFANGGPVVDLYPDFARQVWDTRGCAPLAVDGPHLTAAKQRLLTRAAMLGHHTTDDERLSVRSNGRALKVRREGKTLRVRLSGNARTVRLISRVWNPAHVQPHSDDLRTLGVAISRLRFNQKNVKLTSAALLSGWHVPEPDTRWTNGNAVLDTIGVRDLSFDIEATGIYWRDVVPPTRNVA